MPDFQDCNHNIEHAPLFHEKTNGGCLAVRSSLNKTMWLRNEFEGFSASYLASLHSTQKLMKWKVSNRFQSVFCNFEIGSSYWIDYSLAFDKQVEDIHGNLLVDFLFDHRNDLCFPIVIISWSIAIICLVIGMVLSVFSNTLSSV